MRVFVTGATGFVGANLVRRLLNDGCEVHVLTRADSDHWRLNEIRNYLVMHHEPLEDELALNKCLQAIKPQRVFHLAAYGSYSWQNDLSRMISTNVLGTENLLKCLLKLDCKAVVAAGSSSEYGYKDHAPQEDEMLEPNSEYAITKAAATHMCRFYAQKHGLHTAVLRLYSVYGPFEDPGRLVPTLIRHGWEGKLPPLVRPDIARDFVYVDDVVSAFIAAAEIQSSLKAGSVYNIGTGNQTSMQDVVCTAKEIFNIAEEPNWGSIANRKWDTSTWIADISKASKELGWKPKWVFKDGLLRTKEWHEQMISG